LAACGGGGGGTPAGGGGPPMITPTSFPVGGTITGLESTGLVLQNNGGEEVSVGSTATVFTFPTVIPNGGVYSVSVKTQPNIGPLQACTVTNGDGNVAGASVTSVTVNCVTKYDKFLYVANPTSNTVTGYTINASTGALTAIAGSPFTTAPSPRYVSGEPTGKFVYVTTLGNSTNPPQLSGFSLNGTSGVLTELANSPYPLSASNPPGPSTLAINLPALHPSGLLGYLSIPIPTATLYGAALDTSTGDLSEIPGFPMSVGFDGQTPAIDSTGKYLFQPSDASAGSSGRISAYQISLPSGVLTPNGTPVSTGGNMPYAALTPDGKFLIAVNQASSTIAVMAIDSAGTLSMVGSPVATGGLAGTRPGIFMYERRRSVFYFPLAAPQGTPSPPAPSIAAFAFNLTTGALTPLAGSPYSSNGATLFPWLHPLGKFLYQVNGSTGTLQRYSIDQSTGVPTLVGDVTTPADAPFILIPDPSGRYVYVTSNAGGNVSSYSVDQTTGALTLVNTLPAGTGAFLPQPVGLQ
jgi:6-phosphogluconolactonase (cycloisomerase 2 family)